MCQILNLKINHPDHWVQPNNEIQGLLILNSKASFSLYILGPENLRQEDAPSIMLIRTRNKHTHLISVHRL